MAGHFGWKWNPITVPPFFVISFEFLIRLGQKFELGRGFQLLRFETSEFEQFSALFCWNIAIQNFLLWNAGCGINARQRISLCAILEYTQWQYMGEIGGFVEIEMANMLSNERWQYENQPFSMH